MCCYFDNIARFQDKDIEFSDILLAEKSNKENQENVLTYNIPYKTSAGAKPLHIRSDKIDGFIKTHNGIKFLVFFIIGGLINFLIRSNIL